MENRTHIKHYILYGAERSLNIVTVIIVVVFSKIERRRVWRQGNSSLTLHSVLLATRQDSSRQSRAEVSCGTVHGLKNASSGNKESRNQVHKGTLQEKFKVKTLSC